MTMACREVMGRASEPSESGRYGGIRPGAEAPPPSAFAEGGEAIPSGPNGRYGC